MEFVLFWLGSISGRPSDSDSTKIRKEVTAALFSIKWLHNKMHLFSHVGPLRVYTQAQ